MQKLPGLCVGKPSCILYSSLRHRATLLETSALSRSLSQNDTTVALILYTCWLNDFLWSYYMVRIHNYNANPQRRLLPTSIMKRQILQTWGEITGIQIEVNPCCLPRNRGIIIMPKRKPQTRRQARSPGRTKWHTGRRGITKAARRWADISYLVVTIITSKSILSKNLQLFSEFILILS